MWSLFYKFACHISLPQLLWNSEVVFLWSRRNHVNHKQFEVSIHFKACFDHHNWSCFQLLTRLCIQGYSMTYRVYISPCCLWEILQIVKFPRASAFRSIVAWWWGGRAARRERSAWGGPLTYLVIVRLFAPGQRRQKGGACWLCSQNNWGNGETGTKPQGSSRQGYEALCKRDFVCWFQTCPHAKPTLSMRCFSVYCTNHEGCGFALVISAIRSDNIMLLQLECVLYVNMSSPVRALGSSGS